MRGSQSHADVKSRSLLTIFLLASSYTIESESQESRELSAQEVFQRMFDTYANCETYFDEGYQNTTHIEDSGNWSERIDFSTAFVRPDRFRFEYQEKESMFSTTRYIIWRSGDEISRWWDLTPRVEHLESLSLAIGGAAGVSLGTSENIPTLLTPEEFEWVVLGGYNSLKRVSDRKVSGTRCYVIEAMDDGAKRTVYIGKKDYLVRRIDEWNTFDDFKTYTITMYRPTINKEISEAKLSFNPEIREDGLTPLKLTVLGVAVLALLALFGVLVAFAIKKTI